MFADPVAEQLLDQIGEPVTKEMEETANPIMSHNMNKYFDQVAAAVLLAIRNLEQRLLDRLQELDDRVAQLDEKIDKVDPRIAKKENAIERRGQTLKTKAQKPAAAPSVPTEQ